MMKLRRAAAAAAVTAVMAPAALLAASPAFAADGDPSETPEVVQDAPTPEPQDGDDAEETPQDDTGADETGSAGEGITDGATGGETDPDPEDDNSDNDEGEDEGETGDGSDDGSEDGSDEDEDDESGGDDGGAPVLPDPEDECVDWEFDAPINAELIGLPSQVVAGQWTEFTYRISNEFDKPVETLYAYAEVFGWDNEDFNDIAIELQWFYDGAWENIEDQYGYFGETDVLAPGEYVEAQLRLKVADDAPAGSGYALSTGVYVSAEGGLCQEGEWNIYDFEIVPAGTTPDDKPSTGTKGRGNKPAPQGEFEQLPVTGELAATGSSSALPMFALAGATAVGLGAGAMFLVRRRTGAGIA
ncbi:hypothetical protein OCG20_12450 [Streptomyces sp. G-5]|nr:hypothetical protein [Streptomyces sp. G-5]